MMPENFLYRLKAYYRVQTARKTMDRKLLPFVGTFQGSAMPLTIHIHAKFFMRGTPIRNPLL